MESLNTVADRVGVESTVVGGVVEGGVTVAISSLSFLQADRPAKNTERMSIPFLKDLLYMDGGLMEKHIYEQIRCWIAQPPFF